jgi:hypothetical protein
MQVYFSILVGLSVFTRVKFSWNILQLFILKCEGLFNQCHHSASFLPCFPQGWDVSIILVSGEYDCPYI